MHQDNILFGAPYDEERYQKGKLSTKCANSRTHQLSSVIEQCALKRDLELFAAGDKTEVGEKGITLRYVDISHTVAARLVRLIAISSGGQKIRSTSNVARLD